MKGIRFIHTDMHGRIQHYVTEDVAIVGGIAADTLLGLSSIPKYLLPKYFYDEEGSAIFREIMTMPEYYLTPCEYEILSACAAGIVNALTAGADRINLIEPGSGDGLKTMLLLRKMAESGRKFTFIPVDISPVANEVLKESVLSELPDIDVKPHPGDYFHMFGNITYEPGVRTVVLFLGSNIGNLNNSELNTFLGEISGFMHKGDKMLIGFDLKKSPSVIMNAYSDPHGLTRRFNLNHLIRLNRELDADFNISLFEHHTEYNPVSGELKSYLVSVAEQVVHIGSLGENFLFGRWEPVYMELSRKFDRNVIATLAISHGFRVENEFTDRKNWFVDSLWTRI